MSASHRLAILIAALYLVFMTPLLGRKLGYTVDATPSFQLTRAIVSEGTLFPDVKVKQGWLYSIVYLPFYGLGTLLHATVFQAQPLDWVQRKCMCWMNMAFAAMTLGLIVRTLGRLGYSHGAQCGTALLYGFTTLAFSYARYDYNKTLAGLLLMAAFYFLIRFWQSKNESKTYPVNVLWCGLCFMALLMVRVELAVLAPVFLFGFYQARQPLIKQTPFAAFFSFVVLGVLFYAAYNQMYWSGEASGGYEGSFVMNPSAAILGFLGSPGKSLILFNPIFLLLPLLVRHFINRNKPIALVWGGLCIALFLLYSFWGNWWGGWGYGPRHLVPLLPLLALPIAEAIEMRSTSTTVILLGLGAVGAVVQLLGALVDFNDVILFLTNQDVTEQQLIWQPLVNPIYYHSIMAFAVEPSRWDIGWAWLWTQLSFPIFLLLFSIWIAGLVFLGAVILKQLNR
ncbi:MAG: hypothetical protein P9L94_00145 [Candidatus Hinthialibacter antarcticus]|nr:hypothetical protein [Candidatus Hinthialibacter antarcticus]